MVMETKGREKVEEKPFNIEEIISYFLWLVSNTWQLLPFIAILLLFVNAPFIEFGNFFDNGQMLTTGSIIINASFVLTSLLIPLSFLLLVEGVEYTSLNFVRYFAWKYLYWVAAIAMLVVSVYGLLQGNLLLSLKSAVLSVGYSVLFISFVVTHLNTSRIISLYASKFGLFGYRKMIREYQKSNVIGSWTYIKMIREFHSVLQKAIKNRDHNLFDECLATLVNVVVTPIIGKRGLLYTAHPSVISLTKKVSGDKDYYGFNSNAIVGRILSHKDVKDEDKEPFVEYLLCDLLFFLEDVSHVAIKEEVKLITNRINESIIRISFMLAQMVQDGKLKGERLKFITIVTHNLLLDEIDHSLGNKRLLEYERSGFMETFVLSVGAHDRSIREEGVQLILSIKRHNSQQKKEILNFDAFLDQLIAAADLPNNNRFANLFFNKLPLGKAEARKKIMMNIENFKGELSELKQLA